MSTSCHGPDQIDVVFDHPNLVADSGLLLMDTLAARLGLPGLVVRWVHTGDDLLDAVLVTSGRYAYRRPEDGVAVVPAALLGP